MSVDSVGNFFTIIRNSVMCAKRSVSVPFSNMKYQIANILFREGFINEVSIFGSGVEKKIILNLRYHSSESAIHSIEQVSKPGRRVYVPVDKIPVVDGFGISILTTSSGIVTGKEAVQKGIGGEIICKIW